MAAVERLPAHYYSVDFIFCPLGSWVSLWNFETIRGSLMKPNWQKLASLAHEICTLWFQFFGAVFASKGYLFKDILDSKLKQGRPPKYCRMCHRELRKLIGNQLERRPLEKKYMKGRNITEQRCDKRNNISSAKESSKAKNAVLSQVLQQTKSTCK